MTDEPTLRPDLAARLAELTDASGHRVVLMTGAHGCGKTYLVRHAYSESPTVHFVAPGLTDAEHRRLFVREASRALPTGRMPSPEATWDEILSSVGDRAPLRLVIDGIGALVSSNRDFLRAVGLFWQQSRRSEAPVSLILVDADRAALAPVNATRSVFRDPLEGVAPRGRPDPGVWFPVEPLPYGALARLGWSGPEQLITALVFGGRAGVLTRLDPSRPVSANVRDLVLSADGRLFDEPLAGLAAPLQSPGRYGSICRVLAEGGRSWAELPERLAAPASGSPVGPYLKRLDELSRVTVDRSLDARPRSRGRRYRLTDPFDAFWWSGVLDERSALASGSLTPDVAWTRIAGEVLPDHIRRTFPLLCQQFLDSFAGPVMGSTAREVGALWGEGYDIAVAATLRNGAVVYGTCHSGPGTMTDVHLDRLNEQIAATRYGFGREARIRAFFSLSGFSEVLQQRAVRDPLIRLIGVEELLGEA